MTEQPLKHVASATTQAKEAMEMPKVSRDSAPQRQEVNRPGIPGGSDS